MEIISTEETTKLTFGMWGFFHNTELYSKLLKVKVGEALVFDFKEWPFALPVNAYRINAAFKRHGEDIKFHKKTLEKVKTYALIRVR